MDINPKVIQIELVSKCNLKCVHCDLQVFDFPFKGRVLSEERVKSILDATSVSYPNIKVLFQGIGESILHPKFKEIIQYAKLKGFFVDTTSNLLASTKEEYISLFDYGLDRLGISIDTLNKDIINITRKGTNIDRLVDNFLYISKYHSSQIKILTVVSDINVKFIKDVYSLIKDAKIKYWQILYLNNFDGTIGLSVDNKKYLKQTIKELGDFEMDIILPHDKLPSCSQPFDSININSGGYLMPCCIYWDEGVLNFGCVNEKSNTVLQLYKSDKFELFRKEVYFKNSKICANCTEYRNYKTE